jgi:hypothetical protein
VLDGRCVIFSRPLGSTGRLFMGAQPVSFPLAIRGKLSGQLTTLDAAMWIGWPHEICFFFFVIIKNELDSSFYRPVRGVEMEMWVGTSSWASPISYG